MSEQELFILCHIILFPLLAALIRWPDAMSRQWPIVTLLALGLISEYAVWLAVQAGHTWAPANNLYILADSILIPTQFAVWGFLSRKFLPALIIPLFLLWIYFHIWPGSLTIVNVYYRIIYSFLILLLTISSINYLIINSRRQVYFHPVFIFLAGFLIFYIYQLIYETAFAFSLVGDEDLSILLNRTFALINFVCNAMYGLAICSIPANPVRRWKQW